MNRSEWPVFNRFQPSKSVGYRPASAVPVSDYENNHSASELVLTHIIQELQRQQRKFDSEIIRVNDTIADLDQKTREAFQEQLDGRLTKLSGELTTKFQTKLENELSTALEEQNLASRRDLKGVHIVLEEHQNTASALWSEMSDAVERVESLLRERISVIERQVEDIEIDYRSAHTKLKEALEKKIGNIQSEIHEFFDNQKEHVDNQLQSRLGPLRERQERLESELTAVHSLSNQNRLSIATDFDAKLLDIRLLMEQQNHATEERLNRMELTVKHQQNTIEQIARRLDSATISVDAQKTTANALLEQRLKRLEDSLIHSRPDSNEKDFVKRKDFDRLEKLVNKLTRRYETDQERSKHIEEQLQTLVGGMQTKTEELETLRQENSGLRTIIAQMRQDMEEVTHKDDPADTGFDHHEDDERYTQLQSEIDKLKTQLTKLSSSSKSSSQQRQSSAPSDARLLEISNTLQAQLRALKDAQLQLLQSKRESGTQTKRSKQQQQNIITGDETENAKVLSGGLIGIKQETLPIAISSRSKSPSKTGAKKRLLLSAPPARIVRNFNDLAAAATEQKI